MNQEYKRSSISPRPPLHQQPDIRFKPSFSPSPISNFNQKSDSYPNPINQSNRLSQEIADWSSVYKDKRQSSFGQKESGNNVLLREPWENSRTTISDSRKVEGNSYRPGAGPNYYLQDHYDKETERPRSISRFSNRPNLPPSDKISAIPSYEKHSFPTDMATPTYTNRVSRQLPPTDFIGDGSRTVIRNSNLRPIGNTQDFRKSSRGYDRSIEHNRPTSRSISPVQMNNQSRKSYTQLEAKAPYFGEARFDRHQSRIIERPDPSVYEERVVDTREVGRQKHRVVDEKRLPSVDMSPNFIQKEKVVKEPINMDPYEVSRNMIGKNIVNTYENRFEVRESRPSIMRNHVEFEITATHEVPQYTERIVEVEVPILIEKPVQNIIEIEVPYDVYYDIPIEIVIEKEVITEVIIEKPYQTIIEIPYERIVQVPTEKIIEQEVYYDDIVEVPVERIQEEIIETIVENPIYHDRTQEINYDSVYKYPNSHILPTMINTDEQTIQVFREVFYDNIIEQLVDVPVERIKEVPVEVVRNVEYQVLRERPIYFDNIIEKIVKVPVERVREVRYDNIIEEPVYIDNIVENRYPVEKIVERIVEQQVDNIVERPNYRDNIIQKRVETIKEVYIENVVDVPVYVDKIIDRPVYVDKIIEHKYENVRENRYPVEKIIEVPVEKVVYEYIDRPYDVIHNVPKEKITENVVEKVVEKPYYVDNIIENKYEVEQIKEVEVDNWIERPVYRDKIVEKTVYIEKTVTKPVERLVEKIIEVPYDVIRKVPIDFEIQRDIKVPRYVTKEVVIERVIDKPLENFVEEEEVIDTQLKLMVMSEEAELMELTHINDRLRGELDHLKDCYENNIRGFDNSWAVKVHELRSQIVEIEEKIHKKKANNRPKRRSSRIHTISYINDQKSADLTKKQQKLQIENAILNQKIDFHNQRMAKDPEFYYDHNYDIKDKTIHVTR